MNNPEAEILLNMAKPVIPFGFELRPMKKTRLYDEITMIIAEAQEGGKCSRKEITEVLMDLTLKVFNSKSDFHK